MNCHNQVLKDDPRLALVRESAATGKPIHWVQVHKLPDFAYFNHSVHVNRGISCVHCHGNVKGYKTADARARLKAFESLLLYRSGGHR